MSTEITENYNKMVDRLELIIQATERTKKAFASRLGYDPSLFTKITKREAQLTERLINSIVSIFRVNRAWWETGEGEMFTSIVAEETERYGDLPEPARKALQMFQKHPDKAWEFYAAILERAEKEEREKKKEKG